MVETALKKLWKDTCTVYVQEKTINQDTKRTEFVESVLVEDEPCKLSFSNGLAVSTENNAPAISQSVTLFISNEIVIPPGSKIVIKRGQKEFTYCKSGQASIYTHHQEIKLELFDGWA